MGLTADDPEVLACQRQLAELAHRLWRAQMLARGWSYGPAYDPQRRLHDAMVEFKDLGPVDQRATILSIAALGLCQMLAQAADYPRGLDQELGAAEMRRGMRVALADEPSQLGRVVDWEIDEQFPGCLRLIRVQWDDGELAVHPAAERELRRVEPDRW